MFVPTARSLIALPIRVRRQLQAEEERRDYRTRLTAYVGIISLPFGFLTGVLVWASARTHGIEAGIICGLMMAMLLAGGMARYHQLIFRGRKIPG